MTLDRIHELLREADTAEPGYIDATWDSDLLDAALPLLRRWTDPTPLTFETLSTAFPESGHFDDGDTFWSVVAVNGWVQWHRDDKRYRLHWLEYRGRKSTAVVGTMGQLNMIVDAIEGGSQ